MLAQTFHAFSTGAIGGFAMVALHAAIAFYMLAALLALAALFAPARARMKWANVAGAAATALMVAYFIARFAEAGMAPVQNLFEVVSLSALCVAGAYFAAIRARNFAALGGFVFPAIALTLLVSFPVAGTVEAAGSNAGVLTVLHVLFTVLANGVFVMAALAAAMFLMQERALRRHQTPGFVRNFPSLESLRGLLNQCVWVGLPLLTLGLALGFAASPAAGWLVLLKEPKVFSALVVWVVFAAAAAGRAAGWLHGRRHSYLVLAGLVLVVLSYAALGLFARDGASVQHSAINERITWRAT